jgi:hypothetical protein
MGKTWASPASWDEVCRRAAGRRRYHAVRRVRRELRRKQVLELLVRHGHGHGVQARIARELGVSQATICRDVRALLPSHAPCPRCGTVVSRERVGR